VHAYPYMSNVFMGLADDTAPIAMVDPHDVGAAVAAVAAEPGHDGAAYSLSGPEAITYAQAAEALGVQPADGSVPEPVAQLLGALRDGIAAEPTGAVEALTGRAPNGIAAFARERNKALVRRVFEEVIPSGDADAMRELMAPGFHDHDPLPGQPQGADGGAYVVRTMNRMHPGLRFTVHDLVAERDRVTIRWTLHGRGELSAIVVFRIAAGRIAERWAGWKPGFAPAHVPKLT
jgi:predicted ester cyclase